MIFLRCEVQNRKKEKTKTKIMNQEGGQKYNSVKKKMKCWVFCKGIWDAYACGPFELEITNNVQHSTGNR